MKPPFLFLFIVILIFSIVNFYIISRGWQLLEAIGKYRWIYLTATVLMAMCFLAGMILKRGFDSAIADTFWRVGSWWLLVLLYGSIAALSFDLLRLILLIFGKKLSFIFVNYAQIKLLLFAVFGLILLTLASVGYYNGTQPKVNSLDIVVHKNVEGKKELNIVSVSDMHLGAIYSTSDLRKWVTKINELKPDIVFLVGDTFDDNPAPVIRKNLGQLFQQIEAPLGVYAISGNHEGFGNLKLSMDYLAQHGVQPLLDSTVLIDNRFYVVGRLDRSLKNRKSIEELIASLDKNLPIIVLDHQPYEWNKSVESGTDIHLSGHTHRGQLYPFSLITKNMYECDWGYLQKAQTHFYTSCGIGAWGAPARIGSRSEIVQLKVRFE